MMSWLPENIATYGKELDDLFYLIYYITGAAFVLVTVLLVAFLVMYRERPGRRAVYSHGNTTLEMVWTIVPSLILVVLTFLVDPELVEDQEPHPRVGSPRPHHRRSSSTGRSRTRGRTGSSTPPTTRRSTTSCTCRSASRWSCTCASRDVIHSVFIPTARFKQDAVPGREILQWVEVTKPGKYEIPCAELCGFGHSGMKGYLFVHTPEEYQQWLKEKWPS